jgi:hypothetical protein
MSFNPTAISDSLHSLGTHKPNLKPAENGFGGAL